MHRARCVRSHAAGRFDRIVSRPTPPSDPLALLRATPLFADLDATDLATIAGLCREARVAAGTAVFREGDPGDRLYLIAEGAVRISRVIPGSGEEALTVLHRGDLFGEMAVFERSVRSTDAIADVETRILTITREDLEGVLTADAELARRLLWAFVRLLSQRLRATNDSLRAFLAMSMF